MNMAPKYKKIELLVKKPIAGNMDSILKYVAHDAALIISGNYLIVVTDEETEEVDGSISTSTTGEIYDLINVMKYKTFK